MKASEFDLKRSLLKGIAVSKKAMSSSSDKKEGIREP